MAKTLRYIGIHEDVFIPALADRLVDRGETLIVDDDAIADNLLEQAESWELAVPASATKSELLAAADKAGVDVDASASKAQIAAALPADALHD